jgi:choline dehydrogenase
VVPAPEGGYPGSNTAEEITSLAESETRGVGGPLHISCLRDGGPVREAIIQAGVAVGLPRRDDLNGIDQEGIGYFPTTIEHGRRVSTARAFLAPIKRGPNLTILTDVTVRGSSFSEPMPLGLNAA